MAKVKTLKPAPKKTNAHVDGIAGLPVAALQARQKRIVALLDQIDAEMADGVEYDDEARGRSQRLRGQAEKAALGSVLDYAEKREESFIGLADRDDGHDPEKFETGLLRDRLEGAFILSQIVERVDATRLRVADSALHLTALVKPTVLAAYEIAKPLAKVDKKHGQKLNGARNYYGGIARAGAKTRKQNSAAAAAKP